ncbi:beta strand repeat-containing protein, partial [Maribacter arcticus]
MKAIILFILFIMLTIPTVFGQIKIGDNPQNIDPASVLELESTSKVLVITRVSTLEMEAITPQRGGIVYNIDTECINYYDGTQWVNLCDAVNFTITNDPIINNRATIEITQTASGYNLEIAKNGILGDNIVDGGIGPDDIQDNSITQDKLAAESVGSSEIRQNAVGSDEIRDGSIAPSDIANFIPGQVLITDENGIVQWGDAGDLMGAVGDEITITGSGTPANPLQITEGIQLNISNNTALIADHIIDDQDTDDTNELIDLTFTKLTNTLSISQSATPVGASVDLSGLVGSDDQQLTLEDNNLSLEEGGADIDLTTYLDNTDEQTLNLAANDDLAISGGNTINLSKYIDNTDIQNLGTATLANEQLTINIQNGNPTTANLSAFATDAVVTAGLAGKENIINKSNIETLGNSTVLYPTQNAVKVYVDTEIADIVTSGGSDPINEQNQAFGIVAGELRITDISGTFSVPISSIDTNTQLSDAEIGAFGYIKTVDEQSLTEILVLNNNANGTTITNLPTPSANSDAATKQYVDDEIAALPAGSDNQQLTLEAGNLLTITNDATPINLTQFLDNQVANEVEVTAVPINYIASTQDVEAHLAGIDAALLNSGSTEEADGSTITGIGSNADPFKIEPGANGQFLNTTAGLVTWANLPAGTGGTVEADNTTIEGNGSSLNPLQVIDGSITSVQIEAETILSTNIANGTIGSVDIALGGVETDNILDGTILEIDIADNNVTPDKIEQGGNGEILTTDINGDVIWAALPASLDEQTVDEFLFGAGNLLSISLENDSEIPLTVDLSALEETVAITANTTLINTHITNDGDTDDQNEIELPDDATATSGDVL